MTFSKVVLIPVGLLNVEFRVDPRLKVEFRGVQVPAEGLGLTQVKKKRSEQPGDWGDS